VNQDKAHFSMWCILASPLIAGNDIRTMSNTTRDILTNRWAIAVNQDLLGIQAQLIPSRTKLPNSITYGKAKGLDSASVQVWAKPLQSPAGSFAVVLLNRGNASASITFDFADLPHTPNSQKQPGVDSVHTNSTGAAGLQYSVLDLWSDGASIGKYAAELSATVAGTAVAFYKLVPNHVL